MIKQKEEGKNIAKIERHLTLHEHEANGLVIADQKGMEKAVSMLSMINKISDRLTKDKEELTKPLNETLKNIRARYKPAETAVANAVGTIRSKMMSYQKHVDVENKKKEDALIARAEKGTMKKETVVRKMEELPDASASVTTDAGMVQWMIVKKLVILEEKLIPREYLVVDEVRVKAALKAGIAVPGAGLIEEKIPKNFR